MKLYFDFDHAGVARSVAKFQETRQRLQAAVETAQANLAVKVAMLQQVRAPHQPNPVILPDKEQIL